MASLLPAVGIVLGALLLGGLFVAGRRWRRLRHRVLWENALKQICAAKQEGRPPTPAQIAGRLGLSEGAMLRLARKLESAGLARSRAGLLELTGTGERWGLQILRGHRLWEHYLSGDTQLRLEQLHDAAERAEHRLSAEEISALADHLGHPRIDPHGDVIPTAAGEFHPQPRVSLTDWPLDRRAVVVHVEDEPAQNLREALRAGLQPGAVLRVVERNAESLVCETPAGHCTVSPAVAASIDVRPVEEGEELPKPWATLAALPLGRQAEVVALSEHCIGLSRRRLLDLGLTAGTKVRAVLANLDDAAHAYEIRGSVIALRKEQAEQVLVRPMEPQAVAAPVSGAGRG
jgi:DtxR family Mn-dependent transcriptional regulator